MVEAGRGTGESGRGEWQRMGVGGRSGTDCWGWTDISVNDRTKQRGYRRNHVSNRRERKVAVTQKYNMYLQASNAAFLSLNHIPPTIKTYHYLPSSAIQPINHPKKEYNLAIYHFLPYYPVSTTRTILTIPHDQLQSTPPTNQPTLHHHHHHHPLSKNQHAFTIANKSPPTTNIPPSPNFHP